MCIYFDKVKERANGDTGQVTKEQEDGAHESKVGERRADATKDKVSKLVLTVVLGIAATGIFALLPLLLSKQINDPLELAITRASIVFLILTFISCLILLVYTVIIEDPLRHSFFKCMTTVVRLTLLVTIGLAIAGAFL